MASKQSLQVALVGSRGVGKTALQRCICGLPFQEEYSLSDSTRNGWTLEVQTVTVDGTCLQLLVADPPDRESGNERFRSPHLYVNKMKNMDSILMVYDITDEDTFVALSRHVEELTNVFGLPSHCIVVVANKSDMQEDKKVSDKARDDFVPKHGLLVLETSARTGANLDEAIAACWRAKVEHDAKSSKATPTDEITDDKKHSASRCTCAVS